MPDCFVALRAPRNDCWPDSQFLRMVAVVMQLLPDPAQWFFCCVPAGIASMLRGS
jgi:hypothetical protein